MYHGRLVSAASPGEENLFRLLVESAKDYAIYILDPNGIVTTWNEGAARIKGYRAEEVIGKHFSIFYPPESVAAGLCERELAGAAAEGRFEDEGMRLRKDGSQFWANVVLTALRDERGALIGFAKVTRDLTERRRREEARVQQALGGVLRIHELGVELAKASTPRDVIDILVRRGAEALGASTSSFVRRVGADEAVLIADSGLSAETRRRYARFEISQRVATAIALRTRAPLWIETREEVHRFLPDTPADVVLGAACALPLVVGQTVYGVAFRFDEPRQFTAAERTFVETFVGQAALALDRAEARLREAEGRQRLESLAALAQILSRAATTAEVGRAIVEQGLVATGADTCTLHQLDPALPALVLLDERGCNPEVAKRISVMPRDSENPAWHALETGESVWAQTQERYGEMFPSLQEVATDAPRAKAFCGVPLVTEGVTIGLLGVGYHQERPFDPEERLFIETFAKHCGDALVRARRLEDEQQARASLATTLRSIGDAVIATDAKGRVTMMNPVAETLTGWSESDARGRPLADVFVIVNEHTRAPVVSPVNKVLELGTVVGLANHTVLLKKDRSAETAIDDSGAPIRGKDGRIEGVVLVFRDVTEKKHEEAQRALLEQAGAILAESLEYETTLQKVARLAVPRFADWVGVDLLSEDGSGSRQVAVAHVDPAKEEWARELGRKQAPDPAAPAGVPKVLRTGKAEIYSTVTEETIRRMGRNEEQIRNVLALNVRSIIIVPLLAHGRILGSLSFVRTDSATPYAERDLELAEELAGRCASAIDNARLYDAEQQARSAADFANRAKDEFLATVSHELRTPLNAIMGWAKMLSSGSLADDAAKQQKAISTIDRNAVAMAQLIEDLLDISRIISGKMRIEVQTVHLGRVIEAAIDAVRPAADAKEIEIVERIDADAQSTSGDPARLQQIVWNLLSNAVKFTPKQGQIEIELVGEESGVTITVSDTGKGIGPRFLPHVFDPFRQEDASHTRSRGGLGLGLAITKQLVELHGGSVTASSDGDGKGATFRVHLPVGSSPSAQLQRTGRVRKFRADTLFDQLPQLDGVHALVVDDEEDTRTLLKTVLEEFGARVTLASSVPEALAAIAAEAPTVIVSDIGMPNQDGYDLIREVRKLPPERGGGAPATALTAYARAEDRRRAIDAGFSMHVSKPVDPAELIAVVASLTRAK